MRKWIAWICLLVLVVGVLTPITTVLAAYDYYFPIRVHNNSTTDYSDGLPVLVSVNNSQLYSLGYVKATGLDTAVHEGAIGRTSMVQSTNLGVFLPAFTGGQVRTLNYRLGHTPDRTTFPVIVGVGGNVAITDVDPLELGSDFEIEWDGYVDTSSGSDKNLVYKEGAFRTYVSAAGDITSAIVVPVSLNATGVSGGGGAWNYLWAQGAVYATVLAESNGNIGATIGVGQSEIGGNFIVRRGWTWFNTASIPDAAIITSAVLHLNGDTDSDSTGFDIVIQNGMPAHPEEPLVAGDFDRTFYSGDGGTFDTTGFTATGDNPINLNATGLSWINVAGTTKFCLRSSRDIAETTPTGDDEWVLGQVGGTYLLVSYYVENEVVATGVATGDHVITTSGGETGRDRLQFTTIVNSEVDCGAIYNASAKLWVSFRFMLDSDLTIGGPLTYLWWKRAAANDECGVWISNGRLYMFWRDAGAGKEMKAIDSLGAEINYWNAGQWYWVLASLSDVSAARLRVDDGVVVTDVSVAPAPNGGDFTIGDREPGEGQGLTGNIAEVVTGTDDLLVAEEVALYNGLIPGDEVDYWPIGEGTGVAITSYGSAANPGTAGAATSWEEGDVPYAFNIAIDGTVEDSTSLMGVTVPANGSDWIIGQNNVLPYIDYYKHTVGGSLIAWYEPNTMISGTVLTDRQGGDQNGAIAWGSNPAGIDVTIGALTSAIATTSPISTDEEIPDLLYPVDTGEQVPEPADAALVDMPMYDAVERFADSIGAPVRVGYVVLIWVGCMVLGVAGLVALGSGWGFVGGYGVGSTLGLGTPVWPQMLVITVVFILILGLFLWRRY